MNRLVLFDIDGTLLDTGGAGGRALRTALALVYGTSGPENGYSFAGKTDPQIAFELLAAAGLNKSQVDQRLDELWPRYLERLEQELAQGETEACPGVATLLQRLEANGHRATLGLLTGNLREGAARKLGAAGIGWERFRVGAFGCDSPVRSELPALAVRRAFEETGRRFLHKEVVIVGDTPADIACGESLGVATVAVATGGYTRSELAQCRPDYLFDSLEHTEGVLAAILA
ncbi:MAG: HAD family hydrolase [Longimicrobiaceae bacterium]